MTTRVTTAAAAMAAAQNMRSEVNTLDPIVPSPPAPTLGTPPTASPTASPLAPPVELPGWTTIASVAPPDASPPASASPSASVEWHEPVPVSATAPVAAVPSDAPPSGKRARVPARWWPLALVVVALLGPLAILVDSATQVPFFAFTPGDAQDAQSRINVTKAKTYDAKGRILFVTVGVPRLTSLAERFARRNRNDDVVPAHDVLGDQTPQENRQVNLKLMGYSKDFATYVALKHLGYDVGLTGGGAAVASLCLQASPDGKACTFQAPVAKQLKSDDVIVAIDATPIHLSAEIPPVIKGKAAGTPVTLTVKRLGQDKPLTFTVPLTTSPDDPSRVIIGFIPNDSPPADLAFQFPVGVGIDSGQVGGPSAGLAFTLALLDKLSSGELTGGAKVAATGTMSPSGAVGAIGGLRQKTVAVQRAGAKVFLVPNSEKDEALKQAAGSDLMVIGVATIDDALRALADLGGNAATLLPKSS